MEDVDAVAPRLVRHVGAGLARATDEDGDLVAQALEAARVDEERRERGEGREGSERGRDVGRRELVDVVRLLERGDAGREVQARRVERVGVVVDDDVVVALRAGDEVSATRPAFPELHAVQKSSTHLVLVPALEARRQVDPRAEEDGAADLRHLGVAQVHHERDAQVAAGRVALDEDVVGGDVELCETASEKVSGRLEEGEREGERDAPSVRYR